MSRTLNWAEEIGTIAGPLQPGDTRESWLARAGRKAGISYRQAKSLFYGQTKDPRHSIASKILSAADRSRIEAARRDGEQLAGIYEKIRRVDPDFYGAHLDGFIAAMRKASDQDRT